MFLPPRSVDSYSRICGRGVISYGEPIVAAVSTIKHLLSIAHIDQGDFLDLIERSVAFAARRARTADRLAQRNIGIWFRKTSTRTRTSFIVATTRLGGFPVVFGPADLQTNTGESTEDTVRVLSEYLDALVVRTAADPRELQAMAALDRLSIVNAMTSDEHPTQAVSDLAMMTRRFGALNGLRVLYVGEGNNTAASLALAVSRIPGMTLALLTPDGYGLTAPLLARALELSREFGGEVSELHEIPPSAGPFDVVYTSRWQTTGTEKNDRVWRERFIPFRVSAALMDQLGDKNAVFMHDLPAVRGEECDSSVLDGPQSIAFEQATQKLYTAMAVLDWCAPR
jgi:ornithine carbamoyltransferase